MADIVERLRDWHDYEPVKMFGGVILKDIDEAADEIERLRAALLKAYQFISPISDPMPITAGEMARELMTALNIHHRGDS